MSIITQLRGIRTIEQPMPEPDGILSRATRPPQVARTSPRRGALADSQHRSGLFAAAVSQASRVNLPFGQSNLAQQASFEGECQGHILGRKAKQLATRKIPIT